MLSVYRFAFIILLAMAAKNYASAAVVLQVTGPSSPVPLNELATFNFSLVNDGPAANFDSFRFGVDVYSGDANTPDGPGLPTGMSLFAVNNLAAGLSVTFPTPVGDGKHNYDFLLEGNFTPAIAISGGASGIPVATSLFDFVLSVGTADPEIDYFFRAVNPTETGTLDTPDQLVFASGMNLIPRSLTTDETTPIGFATAVPEPTSFAAIAGLAIVGGIRRVRSRRAVRAVV